MLYTVNIRLEALYKPSQTWHTYEAKQGVRAVSRRHALAKGFKTLEGWPGYADRVNEPEWTVGGEVTIVEPDSRA